MTTWELRVLMRDAERLQVLMETSVRPEQSIVCSAVEAQCREHAAVNPLD